MYADARYIDDVVAFEGPLLQNGAYGMDLMSDTLAHCTLARGTEFGMPLAPLTVLVDYLLDGQQYMVRGSGGTATLMIAPRGRDVTRPNDHGLFPSAGVADGRSKPPLATDNLLENTDGVL